MRLIRKLHRHSPLLWLVALSLGLRSLIAPGFMLNPDGEGPLGISITLCGKAGELAVFDDPHLNHGSSENTRHDHGHEASGGLFSNTCGLWSTSAVYVQALSFDADRLLQKGIDRFRLDYNAPDLRESYRNRQQPRAPPDSSII